MSLFQIHAIIQERLQLQGIDIEGWAILLLARSIRTRGDTGFELIEEFSRIASKEFRATGIRKPLDIQQMSQPIHYGRELMKHLVKIPRIISDIIWRIIKGYQGDILNDNSVTTTARHFQGADHERRGMSLILKKVNIIFIQQGQFGKIHIPPFSAAIDADTTSIMPYYAYPSNRSAKQGLPHYSAEQQFEEVGFALNKSFISDYCVKI